MTQGARPAATLQVASGLVGLALLGTGGALAIGLLGGGNAVVGALLVLAGLVAMVLARGIPQVERLSPAIVAGCGLAIVVGVIVHGALTSAPFDWRRIALAGLGVAMQVAAPFLDRRVNLPVSPRVVPVARVVAAGLALVGTPLLAWAALAAL